MATTVVYRPVVEVLSSSDFVYPFLASTSFFLSSYALLPLAFPKAFSTEKARAWIFTFLSAIVMTAGSLPFLRCHLVSGRASMATSPLIDSFFARSLCAFFVAYLLCDLVVGHFAYRKQMDPWSGYFHHTIYTIMVLSLLSSRVPGGFCTMGILELPTAIMALGCINKQFRNDNLFGATFFATRIAIHIYFIVDLYLAFPGRWLWMVLAGVLPLHLMWFSGWIKQQMRIRGERRKVAEKEGVTVKEEPQDVEIVHVDGKSTRAVVKSTSRRSRKVSKPKRHGGHAATLLD